MAVLTERASSFKIENAIDAVVLTSSDTDGSTIDTQEFNTVFFAVNVGANGGTLDGSNYVEFTLQDSSDGSTWADVDDSTEAGGTTISGTGVWATVDAGGEAESTYKIAYTGTERYVRLQADITGTISLPVGAVAVLGDGLCPQS